MEVAADVDDADAVWPLTQWRVWRKSREARTEEGFGSCRCDRGVIRFSTPICHTFTLSVDSRSSPLFRRIVCVRLL